MSEMLVSRSTVVAAEPQAVFDLIADFRRHPEFDGSGSVRKGRKGPDRLSLGAKFGMSMRIGLPYAITSEVVEFDEPHAIAWRHIGHHVWRYQLDPADGGTKITESVDYRPARTPALVARSPLAAKNVTGMEATLHRFEQIFGTPR